MSEFTLLLCILSVCAVVVLFVRLSGLEARFQFLLKQFQALEAENRTHQARSATPKSGAEAPAPTTPHPPTPMSQEPSPSSPAGPPPLPTGVSVPPPVHAEIPAPPTPPVADPVFHTTPSAPEGATPAAPPPLPFVRQSPAGTGPATPKEEPHGLLPAFSFEAFMGVKLFAWLGGLLFFIGITFLIKYAFDHNLITPALRMTLGGILGVALVVGGWFVPRGKYAVTGQTLCATGIVTLYAVVFSSHSLYALFGLGAAFVLMAMITACAFALAVQMDAQLIAVLGLLGGFLTPILLSKGQDRPLALFSYIALLDFGLAAVALRKRWRHLVTFAAIATVLMQWIWCDAFFKPANVSTGAWIFLGFEALFLLPFWFSNSEESGDNWTATASSLLGGSAIAFSAALLHYPDLGHQPWIVLSIALIADAGLVALPIRRSSLQLVPVASGVLVFLLLGSWNTGYLDRALLPWALGYFVVFAGFHTAMPIVLRRLKPTAKASHLAQVFPALSLVLMLWPALRIGSSTLLWSAVLLADLAAIALAAYTASILGMLAALILTLAAAGLWLARMPVEAPDLVGLLIVIGGFAALFCAASAFLQRRFAAKTASPETGGVTASYEQDALKFLPAISAILPFILLVSVIEKLNLRNPSPVFGVGLLLIVMLLALARWSGNKALPLVGLGCSLLLQHAWIDGHSAAEMGIAALAWPLVFAGAFAIFPFCFQSRQSPAVMPWASAALAGPLHYGLFHRAVSSLWPAFWKAAAGLLPALLALPLLAGLAYLRRKFPKENPARNGVLAWYGGAALFFITLIFPEQFKEEWLTISWALEGAALLWLWHRIPHQGLKITGFVLLCVAFVRLTLNFDVFSYHPRSGVPIANWYLYTFGIPTAALFLGGRFTRPPRDRLWSLNVCAILYTLATLLCFLLLNVEIADFFATGPALTFDFSGNLARDMTYSIGWSLFALGMLIIGMNRKVPAIRYGGIILLVITSIKLVFHDLANLDQLYRIAAFFGVAIVLIGASYLYQRFMVSEKKEEGN